MRGMALNGTESSINIRWSDDKRPDPPPIIEYESGVNSRVNSTHRPKVASACGSVTRCPKGRMHRSANGYWISHAPKPHNHAIIVVFRPVLRLEQRRRLQVQPKRATLTEVRVKLMREARKEKMTSGSVPNAMLARFEKNPSGSVTLDQDGT